MATPSRTSTPKTTNLTPTSLRKMPSPRPVTAGKTLAYKSPMAAMKTPASAHSHNISTSSQPSSTPLLAHAFTEGAVNLDSPSAALMGFSNSHGLTPLPSGLDGLGLSTTPAPQGTEILTRNVEADKIQRLEDMTSLLKTRVTGRGVTRDGVVRVAQLSGFTTYWDEDLLTVAGNCVDLEIMFDVHQKDTVKDVVLKISAEGSDKRQEEASAILKKDLAQHSTHEDPWNSLDSFTRNVGRLRQLDKLSTGVNCFDAVDGLYEALQHVWEEEKKRLTWKSELHHLCQGSTGRVYMNKRQKMGVAVDYWVAQHELIAIEGRDEDIDAIDDVGSEEIRRSQDAYWSGLISCEPGYPGLKVSRKWLSSDVLALEDPREDHEALMLASKVLRPAWASDDLSNGDEPASKEENDPIKLIGTDTGVTPTIDAHFTFILDPEIHLPASVISSLMEQGLFISTAPARSIKFNEVLDSGHSPRWLTKLDTYDVEGVKRSCRHSYKLFDSDVDYLPVTSIGFIHPRHLVDLVPMLRQYACLRAILQRLVTKVSLLPRTLRRPTPVYRPGQHTRAATVQKRNNIKLRMPKQSKNTSDALKIDITLSYSGTLALMKPKLDIIVPLNGNLKEPSRHGWFCSASFQIEENGKLSMLSTEIPGVDPPKATRAAGRILELSEDIGVLVEWMLKQARG